MTPREVHDIAEAKQALRRRFRAARAALPAPELARIAAGLRDRVRGLPDLAHVGAVHAYWPALDRHEPDLRPLLHVWHRDGVQVVLPRVATRTPPTLTHHVWDGHEPPLSGFGLHEPAPSLPHADLRVLDAVLVPALAVDARGVRLGYGGGFYDAFLATLAALPSPPVVLCAVPIACVSPDPLPHEPHDRPVDLVVTEGGVLRVGGPSVP